jgi:hypothetical protein
MKEKHGIIPTSVSDDHYRAIGQVTANWAALEAIISSAIWQIGEIQDEVGVCMTSQIFTYDAKINALVSLLETRGGFEVVIKHINKFHEKTRGLSKLRNRIVHDPWVGDAKTGEAMRLELSSNKTLIMGYVKMTTKTLDELRDNIDKAISDFQIIIKPAIDRYPPLPLPEKSS